ncbi:MAG TPA: FAD binding domain-containing protein [Enhygromyxa sp.]|nr:FAD binding domain-containing protein [Enhygromyxa sp.]
MQPFALIRPKRLDDARQLVREQPEIRVFRAGGIDLFDRMKEGLDEPQMLVELRDVEGLSASAGVVDHAPLLPADDDAYPNFYFPDGKLYAEINALTTLAQLAEATLPGAEALTEAASQAATPSIRNTATIGGNLLQRPRCWYFRNRELVCLKKGGDMCLAVVGDNRYNAILGGGPSFIVHPSSLGAPLLALDAAAQVLRGEPGEGSPLETHQLTSIADIFVGPKQDPTREHNLEPGDVLTSIWIPMLEGMRSAYQAVREKQSHDWPLAEAAVRMRIEADGTMRDVRVALGHVAPIPWNASEAAAMLEGQVPSEALFEQAAAAALAPAKPLDGNAYKVPLSKGLLREVLHRASGLPLPE